MSQSAILTPVSRLRSVRVDAAALPLWEVAVLGLAGGCAAFAVGLLDLHLRIPGHSILQAVLPMALGWAVVPRKLSGAGMSVSAALTAGTLMKLGYGEFGAGAWTSLLALGPAMDLLMGSALGSRWPALAIAVAGLAANTLAFIAKAFEKLAQRPIPGSGMGGGRGMGNGGGRGLGRGREWEEWIRVAPASYLICGLVAGLVCGVILFRLRRQRSAADAAGSPSP
ncbi:MAG: hypothetical protein DWH91_11360 [Planctomycetota bacterium]|nr:MAG: hypothetical protein DWH91_11360 [Planctomycetota bacterium]